MRMSVVLFTGSDADVVVAGFSGDAWRLTAAAGAAAELVDVLVAVVEGVILASAGELARAAERISTCLLLDIIALTGLAPWLVESASLNGVNVDDRDSVAVSGSGPSFTEVSVGLIGDDGPVGIRNGSSGMELTVLPRLGANCLSWSCNSSRSGEAAENSREDGSFIAKRTGT